MLHNIKVSTYPRVISRHIIDAHIRALNLSVRCDQVLAKHGITRVHQLTVCPTWELARMRNLGERSIISIRDAMRRVGLDIPGRGYGA